MWSRSSLRYQYYGRLGRSTLESWLSSHRTSPKTGAALQSTILIDSHGVKQLIADFLNETRRPQAAIDASDADETKAPS